jgi:hypothetical protein
VKETLAIGKHTRSSFSPPSQKIESKTTGIELSPPAAKRVLANLAHSFLASRNQWVYHDAYTLSYRCTGGADQHEFEVHWIC